MLPGDMMKLGRVKMISMLEEARDIATERGATVLGLGGFTSIVSRGGEDLVNDDMAVSTGNTLTSVAAVMAIEEAAKKVDLDLKDAAVAVVGATGSIGRLMSLMLADRVGSVSLVGNPGSPGARDRCRTIAGEIYRSLAAKTRTGSALCLRLEEVVRAHPEANDRELCGLAETAFAAAGITPPVKYGVNLNSLITTADVIVAATNADSALVSPALLRPGALVCDVARPPNVVADVRRADVIVFDGGLVRLPQAITLGPIGGLPPGICWGCLGETILLALEGGGTDWSIGQNLSVEHADRVAALSRKHGLSCAPLQRLGRELVDEDFLSVRKAIELRPACCSVPQVAAMSSRE
jgi:predicted amino acid dehydrogenase